MTDALGLNVLPSEIMEWFADGTAQASGARVDAIAFVANEQGGASGFRFRFTADADSMVAWNETVGYSVFNARMQISTIAAQFTGLEPSGAGRVSPQKARETRDWPRPLPPRYTP